MANKFNKFLGDVLRGFLAPKGNMADFQHASRLYVDDTFRLAPKNKFLYYVVFNINSEALNDVSFQDRHQLELNYLVKSADLPKYTIATETLNQYNRKTNVYTKIQYDPVTITLHDDNNGISNMLWALYYGYYFNDRQNSMDPYSDVRPPAYERSLYDDKSQFPFRYGMDVDNGFDDLSGTPYPFFNSIQLFTLSRQRFFSYLLCNPKITKWDHDTVNQSEGNGVIENKMTLAYDAVIYNSGMVDVDDPAGFALLHYDNTPSPIAGEEIFQNGMAGIFGDLFSLNSFASPTNFLSNLRGTNQFNYYDNIGNQMPFGYGTPNFYGATSYYPYSTGGLQNYGFGMGRNSNSNFLTAAGIGIGASLAGNVLKNVFSNNSQRINQNNNAKYGVETPGGGSTQQTDQASSSPAGANGGDQTSASSTSNPNSATNPDREAGAATGSVTANTGDLASGRAAERSVPIEDAYGPPMPSYGRVSEAAQAEQLRRSDESMVESAQFNGGDTGSRSDRLNDGVTNSLDDLNNQRMEDAASYDQGNLATQTNDVQADAAASDAGGGSYSDFGEPTFQGDVVQGYESTAFWG